MEIVKVTAYSDRGLLRHRIEWVDDHNRGVADSHCTLTGRPLGANFTQCVRHCREHGHFSVELSGKIGELALGHIDAAIVAAFVRAHTVYPDDQDEEPPERQRHLLI